LNGVLLFLIPLYFLLYATVNAYIGILISL
jgi:hypothetical protein